MATLQEKETKLSLRCRISERNLFDQAANLTGKSRTEFMLESARKEAERILLDRRSFEIPKDKMTEFLAALDQPVENPKLKNLLSTKSPWEH